jgi:hypothetical protein
MPKWKGSFRQAYCPQIAQAPEISFLLWTLAERNMQSDHMYPAAQSGRTYHSQDGPDRSLMGDSCMGSACPSFNRDGSESFMNESLNHVPLRDAQGGIVFSASSTWRETLYQKSCVLGPAAYDGSASFGYSPQSQQPHSSPQSQSSDRPGQNSWSIPEYLSLPAPSRASGTFGFLKRGPGSNSAGVSLGGSEPESAPSVRPTSTDREHSSSNVSGTPSPTPDGFRNALNGLRYCNARRFVAPKIPEAGKSQKQILMLRQWTELQFPEKSRELPPCVSFDQSPTQNERCNQGKEMLRTAMNYMQMLVDGKICYAPDKMVIENILPATQTCGRIWLGSDCFVAWIASSLTMRLFIIDAGLWEVAVVRTFTFPLGLAEEADLWMGIESAIRRG